MKLFSKITSFALVGVMLTAGFSQEGVFETDTGMDTAVLAADTDETYRYQGDDFSFTYEVVDDMVYLLSGDVSSSCKTLELPATVDDMPLVSIGDSAFYDEYSTQQTTIETIIIPENVIEVGKQAFVGMYRTGATSITLPKSIETIGSEAFGYTNTPTMTGGNSISTLTNVVIYGYSGTVAEDYASNNWFTFVALDEETTTETSTTTTTTTTTETETTEATMDIVEYEPFGFITLDSVPDQTAYAVGEELDLTGLAVSLYFNSGGEYTGLNMPPTELLYDGVYPSDYPDIFEVDTSAYDSSTPGEYTITISCSASNSYYYYVTNNVSFTVTVTDGTSTTETTAETTTATTTETTTTEMWTTTNKETTTVSIYGPGTTETTTTTTETSTETTAASTTHTTSAGIIGDITLDGNVNLADSIFLNQYVAGTVTLNDLAYANADVNADGYVDADDALVLLKFQVHLIEKIPYTE